MEAKKAVPSAPIPQDTPLPGTPVIFRASNQASPAISLSSPSIKIFLSGFVMLLLIGGVGVGVYEVRQQQQLQSRASNEVPSNISNVVPKKDINPAATLSAKPAPPSASTVSSPASAALSSIVVPELSQSDLEASGESSLNALYDFNSDGSVNSVDLSFLYSGWGSSGEKYSTADLNSDSVINGLDYSLFIDHFNQ